MCFQQLQAARKQRRIAYIVGGGKIDDGTLRLPEAAIHRRHAAEVPRVVQQAELRNAQVEPQPFLCADREFSCRCSARTLAMRYYVRPMLGESVVKERI